MNPKLEPRSKPAVSVVMATYNRPEILPFAIRSVRAQDFGDWELIVVGDHCAGTTAAAVASFDDPRIRYINLPVNHGDQSGPNTVGISLARGRYTAFLNHDDLWLPDHLGTAVGWLETSGPDMVIALTADVSPSEEGPAEHRWKVTLQASGPAGTYDPVTTIGPASSMVVKTDVGRAVGPWHPAVRCFSASSQEWLFRIWYRGFVVQTIPHLTVVRFLSGERPGSYLQSDPTEHAYFEPLLATPEKLRRLLLERRSTPRRSLFRRVGTPIRRGVLRLAAQFGCAPSELRARFIAGHRRGGYIAALRKRRGLPALPLRGPPAAD